MMTSTGVLDPAGSGNTVRAALEADISLRRAAFRGETADQKVSRLGRASTPAGHSDQIP